MRGIDSLSLVMPTDSQSAQLDGVLTAGSHRRPSHAALYRDAPTSRRAIWALLVSLKYA